MGKINARIRVKLGLLLLTLVLRSDAWGHLNVPKETPQIPGRAVGLVAPMISLRDGSGHAWRSAALIGEHPWLLVLAWAGGISGLSQASITSSQLKQQGFEVVVARVGKSSGFKGPAYIHLPRLADGVAQSLGINPLWTKAGIAVIGIDRAGFIRDTTLVRSPRELPPALAATARTVLWASGPVQEGLPAPEFRLYDMNGQSRCLSDLRGRKNLLLAFFPKCFTGG